ncbi:MAG: hypothetical protein ABW023_01390 [Sphingomonas sp.]
MDRFDIRPDRVAWSVCDRAGVKSIAHARTVIEGLRIEDADELAYELSHDPDSLAAEVFNLRER